ncbi:hypothetical protein A3B32_00880 [Candidatus Uhrbacteria bacterium RIFCSPLOWO2_01_FULL_53_9]|uniref:Uncharacterized protein n=2 Tax=Candidatus Uhriibacteriota TaxID=1752732 RepID=A0A1F7UYS8_9BACT|nr:MAG: hypothetical protein A3C17_04485 [Candidatus Uhrbacteria bacterium RIFCSPHIGHO2_02_FULL_53_13]OGL83425.1 MAG: hypothetical protein A3B32_00880 [Candidatus Uhrbacteria bacterium RIFCSPLOWO2_01_FULL_53_9]
MILITKLARNSALVIGEPLVVHDVPSEEYLRVIEETVGKQGGWDAVQAWHVNTKCASFTSSRGLAALVNALASLHKIDVYLLEDGQNPRKIHLPLHPQYDGEPNIG